MHAPTDDPIPASDPILASLERVVVASVGLTALAIAEVAPDLPLLQWRVLVLLAAESDGLPVSAVADRLGSRLPAASRLLGRMRARGLVAMTRDGADARVRLVRMAPGGQELWERVVRRRRLDLRRVVAAARLGEREAGLVDRLAAALETIDGPVAPAATA